MKKQIIAALLAFAMIIGAVPITKVPVAYAAEETDA